MLSVKGLLFYSTLALFIAAVSAGIVLLVIDSRTGSPEVEILMPTSTPTPELRVYRSGAVAAPGVYGMKDGDRLVDAIAAAGGATLDAQLSCVNLAVRVRDEVHFHVPGLGEPCQPALRASPASRDDGIDLNAATAAELDALPGIGKVKAQAIVDYREKNGPFRTVEEIMDVTGIGPATFAGIRDLVYVTDGSR